MRTSNSIKNILSTIVFDLFVGILGFVKVRVFINGLSNDVYSLNQLFYQIFSYITVADIGFGLILAQKFYQEFAKNNFDEINKIYSTSKIFYRVIGIIMLTMAFVISFFTSYLTKANLPAIYIQLTFLVFMLRNVIDYFFVAPRYVLEADQKLYKINHIVKSAKIIETLVEMGLVLLGVDYILILIPGIFLTVLFDLYINKKIYKYYPWLKDNKKFDKSYLRGTWDVVSRKISGLVNSNTDIILVSTFINPISVIVYSSYTYITKYVTDILGIMSIALTPSYANVLNKKDGDSYGVFTEMNTMYLFIATFISIMFFGFLNSLINIWIGKEYITDTLSLLLFCLVAFQITTERPLNIVINSQGLFKETKRAAMLEAILNVAFSFLLVNKFGISGVLIATIIAKLVTTFIHYPICIYKNLFNKKAIGYFANYVLVLVIMFLGIFGMYKFNFMTNSVFNWLLYVLISAVIVLIYLAIIFYICFRSFRRLVDRLKFYIMNNILKRRASV